MHISLITFYLLNCKMKAVIYLSLVSYRIMKKSEKFPKLTLVVVQCSAWTKFAKLFTNILQQYGINILLWDIRSVNQSHKLSHMYYFLTLNKILSIIYCGLMAQASIGGFCQNQMVYIYSYKILFQKIKEKPTNILK